MTEPPLDLTQPDPPLLVMVGSGGVGKTTLAAANGLLSAAAGFDTLVMTFDPSRRLKDALGVGEEAAETEVEVDVDLPGRLDASLLDAKRTFDRLVAFHAPDDAARDRILDNPFYQHLAGHLGGILEYMAVERLWEVAHEGRYQRIILDTPPTREAIDFLEAPQRVTSFLDSGALKIALKPWFSEDGRLDTGVGGILGRSVGTKIEDFLDRVVGMQLLRDMSTFFRAFEPLFRGFRKRALEVEKILRQPGTQFALVTGPGESTIPDTLFFARRLLDADCRLGPVIVNRVQPPLGPASSMMPQGVEEDPALAAGRELFRLFGERHERGLVELRRRMPGRAIVDLPLRAAQPTDLDSLLALGELLHQRLTEPGLE